MHRFILAGFMLFSSVFTPLAAFAQDCEIDLTDSIIGLTQAQADAASGDNSSALGAIADVQAALDDIQQGCAGQSTSVPELTETFTEPEFFTFQYPAGWFEDEFQTGMDWADLMATANPDDLPLPTGGTVTVTSEEITSEYSPYVALEGVQSVTVSVGTPLHLFTELGVFSDDFATTFLAGGFGFDALVAELEARIRQSPAAEQLVVTPVEAERPTVAFEAGDENTDITVLLLPLDEANNWYAMLASSTLATDDFDVLPLLLAIAETVE